MKRQLIAVAGIGAALFLVGGALAHGPGPKHPGAGRVIQVKASGQTTIWILHVARGCHSWSDGKQVGETARVTMQRGSRLMIVNQDIDGHTLIQTSGPRIALRVQMMMGHGTAVTFRQSGNYRFRTKTFEMPGMGDMKTIGPDHELMLVVQVS